MPCFNVYLTSWKQNLMKIPLDICKHIMNVIKKSTSKSSHSLSQCTFNLFQIKIFTSISGTVAILYDWVNCFINENLVSFEERNTVQVSNELETTVEEIWWWRFYLSFLCWYSIRCFRFIGYAFQVYYMIICKEFYSE